MFTLGYDALNRLDEARDPRTGTTSTAYLMTTTRLEKSHDPGNRQLVQYAYDADGRPTTKWNGAGQPSCLRYSARDKADDVAA